MNARHAENAQELTVEECAHRALILASNRVRQYNRREDEGFPFARLLAFSPRFPKNPRSLTLIEVVEFTRAVRQAAPEHGYVIGDGGLWHPEFREKSV